MPSAETGADAAAIFVPPFAAADAIMECADAGLRLVVCITEGIPTFDMLKVKTYLRGKPVALIGPNTPGIISPGKAKIGIMPGHIHKAGTVGIISRSGTLTYEAVQQVSRQGYGQSTAVGIGGDPIVGLKYIELLELFKDGSRDRGRDPHRRDRRARPRMRPPPTSRRTSPSPSSASSPGRPRRRGGGWVMPGAIIAGGKGTAKEKMDALRAAGVHVAVSPADIGAELKNALTRGA